MTDKKDKAATVPRKRRTNRRADTAAAVRKMLAGAGTAIVDTAKSGVLARALYDLGYAMGQAESGDLDDTTLAFARDLAVSNRDRATAMLEQRTVIDNPVH